MGTNAATLYYPARIIYSTQAAEMSTVCVKDVLDGPIWMALGIFVASERPVCLGSSYKIVLASLAESE